MIGRGGYAHDEAQPRCILEKNRWDTEGAGPDAQGSCLGHRREHAVGHSTAQQEVHAKDGAASRHVAVPESRPRVPDSRQGSEIHRQDRADSVFLHEGRRG